MGKHLAICGVQQIGCIDDLHVTDEVVRRELESDLQELNKCRAADLKKDPPPITFMQPENIRKIFWFKDVTVYNYGSEVEVEFSDGHTEHFKDADILEYPTLDPSDYGPSIEGMYQHRRSTIHLIDEQLHSMCGRFDRVDRADIEPLRTTPDSISYKTFCSQCTHQYDGIISKAADLSVSLR